MQKIDLEHNNRPNPFQNNRPGRSWFEGFRKRHPKISIRAAQSLEACREDDIEEDLRGWFAAVRTYLKSKNLSNIDP